MDPTLAINFLAGYVSGILSSHLNPVLFVVSNVVMLWWLEYYNPGHMSRQIQALAKYLSLDESSWSPPPSPPCNPSQEKNVSAMLAVNRLLNATGMPTSATARNVFDLTCGMLERAADTINVTCHMITDIAILEEPASIPLSPTVEQSDFLSRLLDNITMVVYEIIRLYDVLWRKVPERLLPFAWLALYILASWYIWCLIITCLQYCSEYLARVMHKMHNEPVPLSFLGDDPTMIPLPPSPPVSREGTPERSVEPGRKMMVDVAVQVWRRLARVYRRLFEEAETKLQSELSQKARRIRVETKSQPEIAQLKVQVDNLTRQIMARDTEDFKRKMIYDENKKLKAVVSALGSELEPLKRNNSALRRNNAKLMLDLRTATAISEQPKSSLLKSSSSPQILRKVPMINVVDIAPTSHTPSVGEGSNSQTEATLASSSRPSSSSSHPSPTTGSVATGMVPSPNPPVSLVNEDEQKQVISGEAPPEVTEEIAVSKKYAQQQYRATFPNGYVVLPTSGGRLLCGLYAMISTIEAMYPHIVPPSVDDLQELTNTALFREQFQLLLDMEEKIDNYFYPEQLDFLIRYWAAQKNHQLRVGYIVEEENGKPEASIVSAHDDEYRESIVWVHLNRHGVGHYSGVIPKAVYSGYKAEEVVVAKSKPTQNVLNTAGLIVYPSRPSSIKPKFVVPRSKPEQASSAQGDVQKAAGEKSNEGSTKQAHSNEAGPSKKEAGKEFTSEAKIVKTSTKEDQLPPAAILQEPSAPPNVTSARADSVSAVRDENRVSTDAPIASTATAEKDSLTAPMTRMMKTPPIPSKTQAIMSKFDAIPELFGSQVSGKTSQSASRSYPLVSGKGQIRTGAGIIDVKRRSDQPHFASSKLPASFASELAQSATTATEEEEEELSERNEKEAAKMGTNEERKGIGSPDAVSGKTSSIAERGSQTMVVLEKPSAATSRTSTPQKGAKDKETTSITDSPAGSAEDNGNVTATVPPTDRKAEDGDKKFGKRVSFTFNAEGGNPVTFSASPISPSPPTSFAMQTKPTTIDTGSRQPTSPSSAAASPTVATTTTKSSTVPVSLPRTDASPVAVLMSPTTATISPQKAVATNAPQTMTPTPPVAVSTITTQTELQAELMPKPLRLKSSSTGAAGSSGTLTGTIAAAAAAATPATASEIETEAAVTPISETSSATPNASKTTGQGRNLSRRQRREMKRLEKQKEERRESGESNGDKQNQQEEQLQTQ